MTDLSEYTIVDFGPMPPRRWFTADWTIAADKWVVAAPGRTFDMWCELSTQWRCDLAAHECEVRRAAGIPDPNEAEFRLPELSCGPVTSRTVGGFPIESVHLSIGGHVLKPVSMPVEFDSEDQAPPTERNT